MRDKKEGTRSGSYACLRKDFHAVVGGSPADKLSAEEMDLCRFIIGGMQAK